MKKNELSNNENGQLEEAFAKKKLILNKGTVLKFRMSDDQLMMLRGGANTGANMSGGGEECDSSYDTPIP